MTKIRLVLLPALLLILALAVVACGADEPANEPAADMDEMAMDDSEEMVMDDSEEMEEGMDMGGAPGDLDTATSKMTDNGLFHISVTSDLEPLALNEIHSWTVHVGTPDGEAVENAQLTVDGGMPEHNHGFPTAPEISEELGGGDYLLDGVKFSMAGWWELKLTVADGDQSDEVTFNLILP